MIPLANAATDPRAVMVMHGDANVTGVAMEDARGFDDHASWTLLADYVFFVCFLRFASFTHLHTSLFLILRI